MYYRNKLYIEIKFAIKLDFEYKFKYWYLI